MNLKLNLLNGKLKSIIISNERLRYWKVIAIIRGYYEIHSEINEYNSNYWSKFLCIFWFNMSSVISLIFFVQLFSGNYFFKLLVIPLIFLFSGFLLFIIHISSDIYIESNNSYQLLNSLFFTTRTEGRVVYRFGPSLEFYWTLTFPDFIVNRLYFV